MGRSTVFNRREGRLETNIIYGHNGETDVLTAGTPVYIKDSVNDITIFGRADASDPAKMPSVGIVKTNLKPNEEGDVIIGGYASISIEGVPGAAVGGALYVANGGGLTATPGTDPQAISTILSMHAPSGTIKTFIVAFGGSGSGGGGGGELITRNLPWDLGDLSFGLFTGSGTFTPPPEGIGVVDFIEYVLSAPTLTINAVPSSFNYNQTSLNVTVTPTFSAGWTTATVTRILNGVSTEIEATAVSGTTISDPLTLSNHTVYTLVYRLNVSDTYGVTDSVTDTVNQIAYVDPTVTSFVPARTAGASLADNETNYFREIGNFQSSVSFTTNRNTPLVDLTSVDLRRDGVVIDTETPSNPTHAFSHADTGAPTTGASYTYSVSMQDASPYSPTIHTEAAITFGQPVLCTTYNVGYTSSSTNADLQNVISNYSTSAGYYKVRGSEASFTFSAKASFNSASNYVYIMYDSALGALTTLKQGGPAGTEIVFDDLGTFTVTNQFSESLSMRVYRSPFTAPFAENVQVYIEF